MAHEFKRVVIIVPTYNEKGNIDRLVKLLQSEIFPQLDTWDMHILVVDDSSPDGTSQVVRDLQHDYPKLHLLVNPKKAGLGNAYIKGMHYAMTILHADVVFEFDADLQHDPHIMPQMLAKISEGYDMVLGSRYIPGGGIPDNWGFKRKSLSVMGNLTVRIVMGHFAVHDWTGGYRAIRRPVLEAVLPELNQERFMGYTFQMGFLHKAIRKGFRVAEVPFHFKDRKIGQSKLGAEYIRIALAYIVRARAREIVTSRIFKFVVVGCVGAVVQLSMLTLFRLAFPYQLAYFLSVELAVISNFIWSNLWTFADRRLRVHQLPGKFIQFNVASVGSILIQQVLAFVGERYIGLYPLFTLPLLPLTLDTGMLFAIMGILLGMIWNFMAYTKVVWSTKKK